MPLGLLNRAAELVPSTVPGLAALPARVVTNPSGGLLSKGHPLGATGLAQCSELVWQLRGQAGDRQVPGAKVALTCWSANGRMLATAADEQIVVWDFGGRGPEGSEPLQLAAHTARVTALACQPRGTLIAAGARDHRLTLWRPAQMGQPIDADLLADEVALLRWSNDGAQLAVADCGGNVLIYALRQ